LIKSFKFRLQPNFKQQKKLEQTLSRCHELYNLCLEQRKMQRISGNAQEKQLVPFKEEFPEFKEICAEVLYDTIQRLDKAFQNFYRRVRLGKKPGYPRFKNKDRYSSFRYWQGFKLSGKYLRLSKIGSIKLRLSRSLPENSKIKCCTIKKSCGNWYAFLCFEYTPELLPSNPNSIGIDVGIEKFAALSNGTFIENPRFYEKAQKKLRKIQRRFARCKQKSQNRKDVKLSIQKFCQKIQNQRDDFLHKVSTDLVRNYGTVVVENLNISGLCKGTLSKQIYDASWSIFFRFLSYKAAEAGRKLIKVDCKYTSQTCSVCNHVSAENRKSQAEFKCLACGFVCNADTNGAVNILARAELSDVNVEVVNSSVV
jgi:putative transposase